MTYRDVGHVKGHFGRAGSGLLFVAGKKMLVLLRSDDVTESGTWGIPGGAIPVDDYGRPMDALASAIREAHEEIGPLPPYNLTEKFIFRNGDFTYTTFIAKTARSFHPRLNYEHDDYAWWDPSGGHAITLHPGLRALIKNQGEWHDLT